ncbi:MAG: ABC transporter permease [Lachnospiraceae bacterium]|nr:ABC transporter permease [Lachnospiraceae bacterium]
MKVKNRKCIRNIAKRILFANKRRNIITIAVIVLTAILFTTLFTISLSIKDSYEMSICRQCGGWNHGTFKELTDDQIQVFKANKRIKAFGERRIAGVSAEAPFTKRSAEISYMDDNCAKWSFIELKEGHMPQAYNEVVMDTEALKLLGAEPVLGKEIELSFNINGLTDEKSKVTDTFVLAGFWEFDPMSAAHYINVSKEYLDKFNEKIVSEGYAPIRTDLNVLFNSSFGLTSKMEKIEQECGFTSFDARNENYVRYGVNWAYTMSAVSLESTVGMILPILVFMLLVIFTGYLIIYNIFQISVATDIRFYDLLKTIGSTQKQIKRVIRNQALCLCVIAIPAGLILGYLLGALLTPAVLKTSTISANSFTVSSSPIIFVGAALFELVTVFISVSKPERMAGKVSPVEAVRYNEASETGKKKKNTRGAKAADMALANIERNKKKTVLVFVSLALSMVILNTVYSFVKGFDSEKWVNATVCTDFVVGKVSYFKFQGEESDPTLKEDVERIKENVKESDGGYGYTVDRINLTKLNDAAYDDYCAVDRYNIPFTNGADEGMHYVGCVAEGMDEYLIDKLEVFEGDVSLLNDPGGKYVALMTDEESFKIMKSDENAPKVGESIVFATAENASFVDKTTGGIPDEMVYIDPEKLIGTYHGVRDNEFEICAFVGVPFSISPRRGSFAYDMVFGRETLKEAVGEELVPMFYAFDAISDEEEAKAEEFIGKYCADSAGNLEYESKAIKREEFESFKQMFIILGGVLCLILGFVGVLNFFNTILASILSRKNELAVLQAIGMTGKQVKGMLITEGLIYTAGSAVVALCFSLVITPLINNASENMFWFYSKHFSVTPFAFVVPLISIIGILVPLMAYGKLTKASIVDRIREISC